MDSPGRRPASVTAAAVVAMLGSLAAFLFAAMILTTAFIELPPPRPPNYTGLAIGTGVVIGALAILGLATSIALLRMRRWARVSILVFAGALVIVCAMSLAVVAAMPLPPEAEADPTVDPVIRPLMLAIFATPLLVGVWWLVQFNLRSVRDAFAAAAPDMELALPLSVSLTAWVSIVGGVACLIPILLRAPAFLLGATFSGWAAGIYYAFFGALSIYIGRGLLDLRERARVLCIAWYVFTALHTALVTLVPSLRARMLEAGQAFESAQPAPPVDVTLLTNLTLVMVVVVSALAIGFLHRHRSLFRQES